MSTASHSAVVREYVHAMGLSYVMRQLQIGWMLYDISKQSTTEREAKYYVAAATKALGAAVYHVAFLVISTEERQTFEEAEIELREALLAS